MSNSIQQQPENALGKYNLNGEGLIVALLRSVLIFMGVLLVLIVVGMLALDGTFDIKGLVVCEKNGGDCYSKTEQTVTVLMAQN